MRVAMKYTACYTPGFFYRYQSKELSAFNAQKSVERAGTLFGKPRTLFRLIYFLPKCVKAKGSTLSDLRVIKKKNCTKGASA